MTNHHLKTRVLIFEGNSTVLGVLRFLLEGEGYQVTAATNSQLAHQILDQPPDPIGLIILDVADGFKLLLEITLEGMTVPVIFLSAEARPKARVQWAGADDWVASPFHPEEFMARVAAVLRRTRNAPPDPTPQPSRSLPLQVGV